MQIAAHHRIEELEALEQKEPGARRRTRLRCLILAREGWTAPRIAAALGPSRRTVQRIVEKYNAQALAVLQDRAGRGRKPRLPAADLPRFLQRLEAGPTEQDGVCTFTGTRLREVLHQEFGVLYSLNAVYGLLHRHGYSWLMPRPRHEEADPAAQEAFKKTSPPGSRKSPTPIPGRKCSSGSRMRLVSVSKVPSPASGPAPARVPTLSSRRVTTGCTC